MRILIHSINYFPELTGIGKYTGEMAAWLASRSAHFMLEGTSGLWLSETGTILQL